jgi:hypothetical protein
MGRTVKGMINAEMLIATVLLGALAQRFGSQFEAAKVFAIDCPCRQLVGSGGGKPFDSLGRLNNAAKR